MMANMGNLTMLGLEAVKGNWILMLPFVEARMERFSRRRSRVAFPKLWLMAIASFLSSFVAARCVRTSP